MNVSAVNNAKAFTIGGGLGVGIVGIGGGVDIGFFKNTTQAFTGTGSEIHALGNVDVNSLSKKKVTTLALSVGGGIVGAAGSVSVWTVGTNVNTTYSDGSTAGPSRGAWQSTVNYTTGDQVVGLRWQHLHCSQEPERGRPWVRSRPTWR